MPNPLSRCLPSAAAAYWWTNNFAWYLVIVPQILENSYCRVVNRQVGRYFYVWAPIPSMHLTYLPFRVKFYIYISLRQWLSNKKLFYSQSFCYDCQISKNRFEKRTRKGFFFSLINWYVMFIACVIYIVINILIMKKYLENIDVSKDLWYTLIILTLAYLHAIC